MPKDWELICLSTILLLFFILFISVILTKTPKVAKLLSDKPDSWDLSHNIMQNKIAAFLNYFPRNVAIDKWVWKGKVCALSKDSNSNTLTTWLLCTKVIFWQRRDHEKVRFLVPFGKEAVWYQPANIISACLFHLSVNTIHCLLNSWLWLHDCWQTDVRDEVRKTLEAE